MNIFKTLRRNWLWTTLCLLCFFISLTRNFPVYHKLSWWNVCWIALPFSLALFAGGNSWFIFRPIRWLSWPGTRDFIENRFKALKDNAMVYPAIVWLHLGDAERAYVHGGMPGFQAAFDKQTGGLMDALKKFAEEAGEKQCCGKGDCGCHDEKAI